MDIEISLNVRKKIQNRQWLKEEFIQGKTAQEILEFSEETMNQFYGAACRLIDAKRYVDASDAFLFLVTLNSHHYDYWLGLGVATQYCCNYEAAIDAYEMAAICQLENPIPYFYLAKCLFAMHDRKSAMQAIELALEYSEDRMGFEELHTQALIAKELIRKEM